MFKLGQHVCKRCEHRLVKHWFQKNWSCVKYNITITVMMSAMTSQITGVLIVCSVVYSGADQRKHQSSASLAFVRGVHRWPVDSPHKWPVTLKCFHLMSSWWTDTMHQCNMDHPITWIKSAWHLSHELYRRFTIRRSNFSIISCVCYPGAAAKNHDCPIEQVKQLWIIWVNRSQESILTHCPLRNMVIIVKG